MSLSKSLSTDFSTDILMHIGKNYLSINSLKRFSVVDKNCKSVAKDAMEIVSTQMIKNSLISWHCRRELQKFPVITSLDQKIYMIVPKYWVLLSSLGVENDNIGQKTQERFSEVDDENFNMNLQNLEDDVRIRQIVSQEYLRVQLIYNRSNSFRDYLESFETKLHVEVMNQASVMIDAGITADQILMSLFSYSDLVYYGY
jgi:hypothetical protein